MPIWHNLCYSVFAVIAVPALIAGIFFPQSITLRKNIMHSSGKNLALTLTGLCVLGLATVRPAAAQNLVYTLSGVTFNDGATATGYFDFNPITQTFGSYDIATTEGVSDTLTGAHYIPFSPNPTGYPDCAFDASFTFQSASGLGFSPYNALGLLTYQSVTGVGAFLLNPGTAGPNGSFDNSGEAVVKGSILADFGSRAIVTGSLIVTPAAVPEDSTTVSFSLLLALGLGSILVSAKKKKANAGS